LSKTDWATFWAIFLQTHLVTLPDVVEAGRKIGKLLTLEETCDVDSVTGNVSEKKRKKCTVNERILGPTLLLSLELYFNY
jgi:hypothetical protein